MVCRETVSDKEGKRVRLSMGQTELLDILRGNSTLSKARLRPGCFIPENTEEERAAKRLIELGIAKLVDGTMGRGILYVPLEQRAIKETPPAVVQELTLLEETRALLGQLLERLESDKVISGRSDIPARWQDIYTRATDLNRKLKSASKEKK